MVKKNLKIFFIVLIIVVVLVIIITSIILLSKKCSPGEKRCQESNLEVCVESGRSWGIVDFCEEGCEEEKCIDRTFRTMNLFLPSGEDKFSQDYNQDRIDAGISDIYFQETTDYDFSKFSSLSGADIERIRLKTLSELDATKSIALQTFNQIDYDLDTLTLSFCQENSAFDVIKKGRGVCSTMSKVNIAWLRWIGLAARPVSGCAKFKQIFRCRALAVGDPTEKIPINQILEDGRIVMGQGGAHAWVEVWLPETGWTLVESTSGKVLLNSCTEYDAIATQQGFNNLIDDCSIDQSVFEEGCNL